MILHEPAWHKERALDIQRPDILFYLRLGFNVLDRHLLISTHLGYTGERGPDDLTYSGSDGGIGDRFALGDVEFGRARFPDYITNVSVVFCLVLGYKY